MIEDFLIMKRLLRIRQFTVCSLVHWQWTSVYRPEDVCSLLTSRISCVVEWHGRQTLPTLSSRSKERIGDGTSNDCKDSHTHTHGFHYRTWTTSSCQHSLLPFKKKLSHRQGLRVVLCSLKSCQQLHYCTKNCVWKGLHWWMTLRAIQGHRK